MELRNGAPAVGKDFFPRKNIEGKLVRALRRDNVSFLGPRRTGKSSILMHLHNEPPGDFAPILLNLEKHNSVLGWLESMFGELANELKGERANWPKTQKLRKAFGKFCEGLEGVTVMGSGFKFKAGTVQDWRPIADRFLEMLIESDEALLIMLDEFPWFLQFVAAKSSPREVEEVLQWFRSARQKLAQAEKRARFLITGSIGLNSVVRRLGLAPSINDFDVVEIEPLSDEEARDLVARLAADNKVKLEEKDPAQILALLGANWPILLQLFVLEIQDAQDEGKFTSLEDVYNRKLVTGAKNHYCQSMFERMSKVFPPAELRLAKAILKQLVENETGLTSGNLGAIHEQLVPEAELRGDNLENVRDTLWHDGYVIQEIGGAERWRFASNILRDFWRRKTA